MKVNQTRCRKSPMRARAASACMAHLPGVKSARWSQTNVTRYGGCDDATDQTSVEEETRDEIRSGAGGSRLDVLDGWGGISSSRADGRCGAGADRRTWSSSDAWGRRNRRRQPGDVPCLRQGERWQRRTGGVVPCLRRLRRLPGLPRLRLPGLPSLRWMRRLLRFMGRLPLVLSQAVLQSSRHTQIAMAGFDNVDPANPCSSCSARSPLQAAGLRMTAE